MKNLKKIIGTAALSMLLFACAEDELGTQVPDPVKPYEPGIETTGICRVSKYR